ncbi:PepSY-associated TM helix domain-containing protein [Streptomyces sp. 8L]|uniref:PepSY-associated TM helix domain-containing protein n=1 Tax=Streptomyces sp. 8L TaxID=2877242 RepID=UPI001CD5998F|nr:PepSY-associated TM helix domain-containing protein [Streptomyces sp. 8L]MCA1218580.1 PepSY domain-containing protein [Streptomyces sp. 8L]
MEMTSDLVAVPPGPTPPPTTADREVAAEPASNGPGFWRSVRPLLLRLHFYVGVCIGPFLLVAALTGLAYTTTPQLEQILYRHELTVSPHGSAHSVADQLRVAERAVPRGTLQSVEPPATATGSTRVLFTVPGLPDGYNTTAFVDPYTGKLLGTLRTYGDWLPARAWLDSLHRTLHLGDFGRNYSELAASWLWVEVLGGLVLWIGAPRRARRLRRTLWPRRGAGRSGIVSWHGALGLWISIGLLGLSATGLTWSAHAGASIGKVQDALKGGTPSVATTLPRTVHGNGAPARDIGIDGAIGAGHRAGLAGPLVITPPSKPGVAYVVKENKRSWPEGQDSVAVDPSTGRVTARLRFADFPLLAKLTRWGIDAHMGLLFGLANQIALAVLAVCLIAMVLLGYRMWWRRRPTRGEGPRFGRAPARGAWRALPGRVLAPATVAICVLAYYLPLFGFPLAAFLCADLVVGAVSRGRAK